MKEIVSRYAAVISDLEQKVDQKVASAQTLNQRQEKLEQDVAGQMQKIQKAVVLAERIEEAIAHQNKLARRIEQITQDKARMLRKLERIEETVIETQNAVNAGALTVVKPATQGGIENDEDSSWLDGKLVKRLSAITAAALLGAAAGWGIYQSIPVLQEKFMAAPAAETTENVEAAAILPPPDNTSIAQAVPVINLPRAEMPVTNMPVTDTPAPVTEAKPEAEIQAQVEKPTPSPVIVKPEDAAPSILQKSDDELVAMLNDDPDALAAALNDIAPSVAGTPQDMDEPVAAVKPATPAAFTPPQNATSAREFSTGDFIASQRQSGSLRQRIAADPALPAPLKEVETKAFENVAEAQHDLAAIYTAGHGGVKPDYARAAQWFREAAVGGIANARYNLGVLYHQGLGVKQDLGTAISWYRAAASQDHPEAQYNLGIAYIEGVGTEYNPVQAARHFEMAARGGIMEAAYNLGLIHENGLLGAPTYEDAIFWYKRAADMGSPEAKAAMDQLAKTRNFDQRKIDSLYAAKLDRLGMSPIPEKTAVAPRPATQQNRQQQPAAQQPLQPVAPRPAAQNTDSIPVLPLDGAAIDPVDYDTPAKASAPAAQSRTIAGNIGREQRPAAVAASATVAQIQEQLMKQGLFPGPVDGVATDIVSDAIAGYQRANNLPIDGRASEALLVYMLTSGGQSASGDQQ